jgi:hypothetical protein
MPKLKCPCGYVHNLSPSPDDGWITVRDGEYESLIEDEIASRRGDNNAENRVTEYCGQLYECPECGRLMWEKPNQDVFTIYRIDDG